MAGDGCKSRKNKEIPYIFDSGDINPLNSG